MGIILKPIDIVDDITKEEFFEKYLKPRKPVVIKNMARKWPAYQKWTMDYMKQEFNQDQTSGEFFAFLMAKNWWF